MSNQQAASAGPVAVPTAPKAAVAASPKLVARPAGPPAPAVQAKPAVTPRQAAPAPAPQAQAPKPAVQPPTPAVDESSWRMIFEGWPQDIPKRGIVVSQLNEPCQFKSFMLRGEFVLLERVSPDSMGGRFLVLQYGEIAALKFTDPLKQPVLEAAGFEGDLAK